MALEDKRRLIEPCVRELSIARQCELLGLNRSSWYYKPCGVSEQDLQIMRLIDQQYTRAPFFGFRRMKIWLAEQGQLVNHKRVRRLMRLMGIEAIYPKPKPIFDSRGVFVGCKPALLLDRLCKISSR